MTPTTRAAALAAIVLALSGSAAAFEPVRPSEVESLTGKKVYVEMQVEVRRKNPFKEGEVLVGQEVTLKGREQRQIDAWCVVTDAEGHDWEIMVENLSKTKPAYSQVAPGTLEELLPKIAAEAIDIPAKLADLWKANDYVLEDENFHLRCAYEKAYQFHSNLIRNLVDGRTSRSQILEQDRYRWLWNADPSIVDAYCEGMTYLDKYKNTPALARAEEIQSLVKTAGNQADAAGDIMMAREQLKRRSWMSSLRKDAPEAQKQALDREETAEREKKIAAAEERLAEARERVAKKRGELGI